MLYLIEVVVVRRRAELEMQRLKILVEGFRS